MNYLTDFRDQTQAEILLERIRQLSRGLPQINLMEVCGTHTMAISRFGLRKLLPDNIRLVSGPGCPVCVTPECYLDQAIILAEKKNVCLTTFGDMMRVPASHSSLEESLTRGSRIIVVYSPLEALELARRSKQEVVFLAIGFETTAPAVASVILLATRKKVKNFSVLVGHKLIPPAMDALLCDGQVKIDGFICPGHVSAIIGTKSYQFIPEKYGLPCVIAGFELIDILQSIVMLLEQIQKKDACVQIQYSRCVRPEGNEKAWRLVNLIFETGRTLWRGLGTLDDSGLYLRKDYSLWDACWKFDLPEMETSVRSSCRCGDVLKGLITPQQCPLFKKSCSPSRPKGPCMVSSEGTCAAYYRYEV